MYTFRGRPVILSLDAIKNQRNRGVDQALLERILEDGEDYRDTKTARGEIGRAIRRGRFLVFAKIVPYIGETGEEEAWLVKHIGVVRRER